jgi:hypothetical protein
MCTGMRYVSGEIRLSGLLVEMGSSDPLVMERRFWASAQPGRLLRGLPAEARLGC